MSFENYRWTCSCCGKQMTGLPMHVSYKWPDVYDPQSGQKATLAEDFCWIEHSDGDIDRAIRCVLNIPVEGFEDYFSFGIWMSVSQQSWDIYAEGFKSGMYEKPTCFGYLMNKLPYPGNTFLLQANVTFSEANQRPVVWLHDADEPLVEAQREGVSLQQVEKWVASVTRHHH